MRRREPLIIQRLVSPDSLHRASVCVLTQGIESVGIKEFAESAKLPVVINTQRSAVCSELDQGIQVLPSSELLLCLMIQERVELAPDTPVHDMFRVLVIRTHDGSLSPYLDGVSVLSLRKHCSTPGWRLSKMRFHDTILPPLK